MPDDHPDNTGPEQPDEETAARDAEPTNLADKRRDRGNGKPIADQAEDERPLGPEPPPIPADQTEQGGQLTFAGIVPRRVPIEYEVVIHQKAVPGLGLLDPNKEPQFLVSTGFAYYQWKPVKEGGQIVRWKCVQHLEPTYVMKPEQWEGFVEEQQEFDAALA